MQSSPFLYASLCVSLFVCVWFYGCVRVLIFFSTLLVYHCVSIFLLCPELVFWTNTHDYDYDYDYV